VHSAVITQFRFNKPVIYTPYPASIKSVVFLMFAAGSERHQCVRKWLILAFYSSKTLKRCRLWGRDVGFLCCYTVNMIYMSCGTSASIFLRIFVSTNAHMVRIKRLEYKTTCIISTVNNCAQTYKMSKKISREISKFESWKELEYWN